MFVIGFEYMKNLNLEKRTWIGKWIEPVQEAAFCEPELTFEQMVEAEKNGETSESHLKCVKHLRKVVDLRNAAGELPVKARIYASAHGVYDLYVNGKKADERHLAPETTNYNKLIWYQAYDVTSLIAGLEQASVDILLGDGWWIGRLGMSGSSCNYGDKLGFIMDMELLYADGSTKTIASDKSFRSCDSFIRYSDLYIGEMQDGNYFDAEDITAGDEMSWDTCCEVSYPTDLLALQPLPAIKTVEEIPAAAYLDTPKGELIIDFGKVIAGTVRAKVKAASGTIFTIEHSEVLDTEGNFYCNIKGMFKDQKVRYVCNGKEQILQPHFTYQGFRYIRITGITKADIQELTALVYGTPLEKIGEFETDNKLINGLQSAIERSTIGNMISVPTDCPQREKLGWTGDINAFTRTGAFLYDLRAFLKSWLLQLRMDQCEDGEIPVVVPNHPCQDRMQRGMSGGSNSSAAWSDCCIFIPLNLYRIYGDISYLEDNYETMQKWMSYVEKQAHDFLWIGRFHFGDWLIPSLRELPDGVMRGVSATADIVGSCYYSMAAAAMADVCYILNKKIAAANYKALCKQINQAILENYVHDDGTVGTEPLQGLYVVILKANVVEDPELKTKIVAHLVNLIEKNNYSLDCGFASISHLLDVLYENGRKDIAYKMLFCENAPSWLYMVKMGATAIWENWRAILEDGTVTDSSYNHYAYGCVGDFIYRHIGGIEALEPGYQKIRIAPDTDCGLKHSHCARKTSYGTIECTWDCLENGQLRLHMVIPAGITAEVELKGNQQMLSAGSYDLQG